MEIIRELPLPIVKFILFHLTVICVAHKRQHSIVLSFHNESFSRNRHYERCCSLGREISAKLPPAGHLTNFIILNLETTLKNWPKFGIFTPFERITWFLVRHDALHQTLKLYFMNLSNPMQRKSKRHLKRQLHEQVPKQFKISIEKFQISSETRWKLGIIRICPNFG